MASRLALRCSTCTTSLLMNDQAFCFEAAVDAVEDAVHESRRLVSTVFTRQLDGLAHHHARRRITVRHHLVNRQAQDETIQNRHPLDPPVPGRLADAFVERIDGIKTYARGYLSDADGHTVEADGVFIQPVWARDAG